MILKEFKSLEKKKLKKNLDILYKRYIYITNTNIIAKQKYDYLLEFCFI